MVPSLSIGLRLTFSTWGKAIGNGFAVYALAGKRELMEAGRTQHRCVARIPLVHNQRCRDDRPGSLSCGYLTGCSIGQVDLESAAGSTGHSDRDERACLDPRPVTIKLQLGQRSGRKATLDRTESLRCGGRLLS
jgi:hypothetical protein